jgi:hypothetical protein
MFNAHKFEKSTCRFGDDKRYTQRNTLYETNCICLDPDMHDKINCLVVESLHNDNIHNFFLKNPD